MVYKGFSSTCYWSLRREEALAHSSSAARHATPRHDAPRRAAPRVAGLSRAELTPTRLFLPVTNGEFLTAGPRSDTSDRGMSRTWVEPAAAPI